MSRWPQGRGLVGMRGVLLCDVLILTHLVLSTYDVTAKMHFKPKCKQGQTNVQLHNLHFNAQLRFVLSDRWLCSKEILNRSDLYRISVLISVCAHVGSHNVTFSFDEIFSYKTGARLIRKNVSCIHTELVINCNPKLWLMCLIWHYFTWLKTNLKKSWTCTHCHRCKVLWIKTSTECWLWCEVNEQSLWSAPDRPVDDSVRVEVTALTLRVHQLHRYNHRVGCLVPAHLRMKTKPKPGGKQRRLN